jgi:cob(I)alamin adenosyltransferase
MLHLYIGDGKGKTSCSLGIALRAAGWGKKICIFQFLKDDNFPCGEINALKSKKINIAINRFPGQIHPIFLAQEKFDFKKTKKSVLRGLKKVQSAITGGEFDLIILDEILDAVYGKLCSLGILKNIIKKATNIELVMTGRRACAKLIKQADYVSFIKKIKHPFDKKIAARKGIEY